MPGYSEFYPILLFFFFCPLGEIFSSGDILLDTVRLEDNKLLLDREAYKKWRIYVLRFEGVFEKNRSQTKRSEMSTIFSPRYNIRHKERNKYHRYFSSTPYELKVKFNEKTGKFENIFPLIYSQENLEDAWHEIKGKQGNMTPGEDFEALDSLDKDWFKKISVALKSGTHQYRPIRRTPIFKPGKTGIRQLTIGSQRDKIIQQAFLRVLQQVYEGVIEWVTVGEEEEYADTHYVPGVKVRKIEKVKDENVYKIRKWIIEPRFHEHSYGFRPNRSSHMALKTIKKKWRPTWLWSADLVKAFDKVNHHRLMNEINKTIDDPCVIKELWKMLNIKSVNLSVSASKWGEGTPQGSVLSPFLFNVYMTPLDNFIEDLKLEYDQKNSSIPNPEFYRRTRANRKEFIGHNFRYRIKMAKLERDKAKKEGITRNILVEKGMQIYYVRFADDFLMGFEANKELTKKFIDKILTFVKSDLLLDCHEKNSKLSHGRSELVPFLGFKVGLYPFKYSTKSRHITRFKKLKAMVQKKKIEEAELYFKMLSKIGSEFHKRILESCRVTGQTLMKKSNIKIVNDHRIKARVVKALKRSLSDIEADI